MRWNDTVDRFVWASVAADAQTAFPELSNDDWIAAQGDRSQFLRIICERRGIDLDSAERLVAGFESTETRFVY